MRLAVALVLALFAVPAAAQDAKPDALPGQTELQVGAGLVCDTQQQAERYIELFRGDPQEAADAVNAEVGEPEACTFGTVAFIRGADVAKVRDKEDKPLSIAEILVLGVGTPAGLVRIEPVRWYTIFPVEEITA